MALMKKRFAMVLLIVLLAMGVGTVSVSAVKPDAFTEVKLVAGDATDGSEFGRSVAIDGDLVAVGAGNADTDTVTGAGAVYLFKRQGRTYISEAKLTAPDATPEAEFGRAVVIRGNTVFVGARFAQAGTLTEAGAVYVFRYRHGSWDLEQKIVSPNAADGDNFGRALAVQGGVLVITARKESQTANDAGAAYVYRSKGGSWNFDTKLVASDAASNAYFGQSVDIERDVIAIGARNADPNSAGAVYLFRQSKNGWTEFSKLTPADGIIDDNFGFTVDLSGNVLAVGARRADLTDANDAGAVYVYTVKRDTATRVAKLTAGDAKKGDQFGQSVAIAGDVIAVGAWKNDIGDNADQGSIYLFRQAGGQWTGSSTITASDGVAGDEFGYSLAATGNRMVTGAHFVDAKAGAAYVLPVKP